MRPGSRSSFVSFVAMLKDGWWKGGCKKGIGRTAANWVRGGRERERKSQLLTKPETDGNISHSWFILHTRCQRSHGFQRRAQSESKLLNNSSCL